MPAPISMIHHHCCQHDSLTIVTIKLIVGLKIYEQVYTKEPDGEDF